MSAPKHWQYNAESPEVTILFCQDQRVRAELLITNILQTKKPLNLVKCVWRGLLCKPALSKEWEPLFVIRTAK